MFEDASPEVSGMSTHVFANVLASCMPVGPKANLWVREPSQLFCSAVAGHREVVIVRMEMASDVSSAFRFMCVCVVRVVA